MSAQPVTVAEADALRLRLALRQRAGPRRRSEPVPEDQARSSLLAFTRCTFPRYAASWHHERIAEKLEAVERGEISRLMIFMPPRHGKTELASIRFPAWYLGRNPDRRVITCSYSAALATRLSRQARNLLTLPEWPWPHRLAHDSASAQAWDIAGHRGGLIAAGVGGPITGSGAHILIIDDPVKNAEEASSPTFRENVWDWYTSTAYTRLEDGGAIILVQCMTGETPVRMADGTERPLRDIHAGDCVATYDRGTLAASTVLNHASQGYDNIYRITMTSGAVVRANARHPFLVDEGGQLRWIRLSDLTTGHRIVTARGSGASGRASSAPLRDAGSRFVAGDSACRITPRKSGPAGIAHPPSTRRHGASATLSIGTVSPPPSMVFCWPLRTVSAPSASSSPAITSALIGVANSASITITTPEPCADCSATIATLPLATPRPKRPRERWSNTSDFTTERIASIEPAGVAEVFDLQIAHTENFIANGLVSHNTRWHHDDLAGRLHAAAEQGGDRWDVLTLPALDAEGNALWPDKYDAEALDSIRRAVGGRVFTSLYQQAPTDEEGAVFRRHWWRRYGALPKLTRVEQFADSAFKEGVANDYSVVATWGTDGAGNYYVLDVRRGRYTYPDLVRAFHDAHAAHEHRAGTVPLTIEDKASGQSAIQTLSRPLPTASGATLPRLPVLPFPRDKDRREHELAALSKVARAEQVSALVEAGAVYLPEDAPWVADFIAEHEQFPNGAHDDQVDTTSMALIRLAAEPRRMELFA